jgi:hypothetical protein
MLTSFWRFWNRRGGRPDNRARRRTACRTGGRSVRPALEALEDRTVPTVAFAPQFGNAIVPAFAATVGMQHPPVYLIFSGSYWTTPQGQQDENTFVASAQNILGGPYLSGLTQYGSDGRASWAGNWNDLSTVPLQTSGPGKGTPSTVAVQTYLQATITGHPGHDPGLVDSQHAPIYVVISDPTSSAQYNGGWNVTGSYLHAGLLSENIHMVWIGTATQNGAIEKDVFTGALSHELAETISDPDSVQWLKPPSTLPPSLATPGGGQIGDYEPAAAYQYHYGYRLNGDVVQPYWSGKDSAFIVPDGNKQTFTLWPVWNGTTFANRYSLFVAGDQLGQDYADQVYLDRVASGIQAGGVLVKLNFETATFDPNLISGIVVNPAGGQNAVAVAGLPTEAALTVGSLSLHPSNDTVTIGYHGSLSNIAGSVDVSNYVGQTALIVSESSDAAGRSITVTNKAVTVAGLNTVYYTGAFLSNGAAVGVTSLEVDGGPGGNTFAVNSTHANTPVTLFPGARSYGVGSNSVFIQGSSSAVTVKSGGNDSVVVGNAGSLASIGGPVDVSNLSGHDSLTIDDSLDRVARSIDLTDHSVSYAATPSEPAVTVNYQAARLVSNVVIGVNHLVIDDPHNVNFVEVDSVGPLTSTLIFADWFDTLTGPALNRVTVFRAWF